MNVQHGAADFEGLVACITGGSSGIGLATARALAASGARVELLDLQPPIGIDGAAIGYIACDVSDRESVNAAVAEVVARQRRIDIVVANAGIG